MSRSGANTAVFGVIATGVYGDHVTNLQPKSTTIKENLYSTGYSFYLQIGGWLFAMASSGLYIYAMVLYIKRGPTGVPNDPLLKAAKEARLAGVRLTDAETARAEKVPRSNSKTSSKSGRSPSPKRASGEQPVGESQVDLVDGMAPSSSNASDVRFRQD